MSESQATWRRDRLGTEIKKRPRRFERDGWRGSVDAGGARAGAGRREVQYLEECRAVT